MFENQSGAGGDIESEYFLLSFKGFGVFENVVSAIGGVVGV